MSMIHASKGLRSQACAPRGAMGMKGAHEDGFVCSVCGCHHLCAADRRLQSTRANDGGRRVADADPDGLRTGDHPSCLRTADGDSNVVARADADADANVTARADAPVHPGSTGSDQPSGRLRVQQLPQDHDL